MIKTIMVANNSKEPILIPKAGRYGSMLLKPGVVTIHEEHWTAIKGLVNEPIDSFSMAFHNGVVAEIPPKKLGEEDTEPALEVPKSQPKEKATEAKVAGIKALPKNAPPKKKATKIDF